MLGNVDCQKVCFGQAQDVHQFFHDFGRRAGIFGDNVSFALEKIFIRRLDARFLAPRHRVPGDVENIIGQNFFEFLPYKLLCTARVSDNRAAFEERQNFFNHRNNLEDGRA